MGLAQLVTEGWNDQVPLSDWASVADPRFAGGAKGDGIADDSAAFQAAINSLTSGGLLYIPSGYFNINNVQIAKPVKVTGNIAGYDGSGKASSILTKSGNSGFVGTCPNIEFSNLQFLANSYQGDAIAAQTFAIKAGTGGGDSWVIGKCRFQYYYTPVSMGNGQAWTIADNNFHSNAGYDVFISNPTLPDAGDANLKGNFFSRGTSTTATASSGLSGSNSITFTTTPTITVGTLITGTGIPPNTSVTSQNGTTVKLSTNLTATASGTYTFDNWAGLAQVRQESSGGTRVLGNKFLAGNIGYEIAPADGLGTTILIVVGNSFELHTNSHIHMTAGGAAKTGSFGKIVVTGNEFTALNVSNAAIYCDTTTNQFSNLIVTGNFFNGTAGTTSFCRVSAVNGVSWGGNQVRDGSLVFYGYGGTGNVKITPDAVINVTGAPQYRWDSTGATATAVPIRYERSANFSVTSSVIYSQILALGFNAAGACVFEIEVVGTLTGGTGGGIVGFYKRAAVLNSAGTPPVITVIGTDTQGATPFDIALDTSVNNQIGIQIRRNAGDGGTQIQGAITVRANGTQNSI